MTIGAQVAEVLARFDQLVSSRDLQVLEEFVPGDEVLLVGSEAGEVAAGRQSLKAFFQRVYSRPVSFSWEWERIEAWQSGEIAWFFADGLVALTGEDGQRTSSYRVAGVLERRNGRWLWRIYHGSEPAS